MKQTSWKYFTLFCDDGTKISGSITQNPEDCDLWLSIYGDQTITFQNYYPKDRFSSPTPDCYKIGNSFLSANGENLSLCIQENGVELRVNAKSAIDWPDNKIEYAAEDKQAQWQVPFLKSEFTGTLTVEGRKRQITGTMFHDHVQHNILPTPSTIKNLKSWTWGILYSKTYTILFVYVDYIPKQFKFLCINDGKETKKLNPEEIKIEMPKKLKHSIIEIPCKDDTIKIGILKEHDLKHGKGMPKIVYNLLKAKKHYTGKFTYKGEEGEAYIESLRLR